MIKQDQPLKNDHNEHLSSKMLIRTCNAMKTNHNDQLHVQHTTNAKYTKYMHLGYKILLGYKCEVLKTY